MCYLCANVCARRTQCNYNKYVLHEHDTYEHIDRLTKKANKQQIISATYQEF